MANPILPRNPESGQDSNTLEPDPYLCSQCGKAYGYCTCSEELEAMIDEQMYREVDDEPPILDPLDVWDTDARQRDAADAGNGGGE